MINQNALDKYKKNFKHIRGWFHFNFIEEFFKLDAIHQEKNIKGNILEIGVYQSKSFIPLSFLLKNNEQIIGIDLFLNPEDSRICNGTCANLINWSEKILKNIYGENLKNLKYKLIQANSQTLISNNYIDYLNNNLSYRIIHIDGNHEYDCVKYDLEQSKNIIIKNGYIILDDYGSHDFPHVKTAVDDFLLKNKNFKIIKVIHNKIILEYI
jgi:hypothetical protein